MRQAIMRMAVLAAGLGVWALVAALVAGPACLYCLLNWFMAVRASMGTAGHLLEETPPEEWPRVAQICGIVSLVSGAVAVGAGLHARWALRTGRVGRASAGRRVDAHEQARPASAAGGPALADPECTPTARCPSRATLRRAATGARDDAGWCLCGPCHPCLPSLVTAASCLIESAGKPAHY